MIYFNELVEEKLKKIKLEELYIVADFDRTLTKGNSKTSWSIISNSNIFPEYTKERDSLYEQYRPIEIDPNIDESVRSSKMKEWFQKHMDLFLKYKMSENIIEDATKDTSNMEFRVGGDLLLKFLNKNNIPLIVISAGIGNFITSFLNGHNILFPNIYIASNILKFENGLATSYVDNIIHSFNKEETSLPESIQAKIKTKKSIILLGDQISDLKMVKNNEKNLITIGFLSDDTEDLIDEYRNNFDIVCTNDISYQELFAKILNVEI